MKNIGIAIRSLFKRGQHNVMKIISLGIGLTIGLGLIAKSTSRTPTITSIRTETGSIEYMRNFS